MRRIIASVFILLMLFSTNSYAINYDFSFLQDKDVYGDLTYMSDILEKYKAKYVVSNEAGFDTAIVNEYYEKLSEPITLKELDTGNIDFQTKTNATKEYQQNLKSLKILGGLSGIRTKFEPIAIFNIYRDITIIGGYAVYETTHSDSYEAYWQYICSVENMTKEIVPYGTRSKLVDKFKELYSFIESDSKIFKIFILKDGKIDSHFIKGR